MAMVLSRWSHERVPESRGWRVVRDAQRWAACAFVVTDVARERNAPPVTEPSPVTWTVDAIRSGCGCVETGAPTRT
jgi:hypothetical protein